MRSFSSSAASTATTPSTASRGSLLAPPSSVQIGDGSFSPGDIFVESLLPRVRVSSSSLPSSSSHKPGSRDGTANLSVAFDATSTTGSNNNSINGSGSRSGAIDVLPLHDHPSVRRAQEECATLLNGNDVCVVEDHDVNEPVVQVTGHDAEVVFPCRNIFRYLVFFLKDMDQFVEIYVTILDDKQIYREIKATNARSLAKIESTRCQLPMVLSSSGNNTTSPSGSWRYICLNLHELTCRAFGTKHITTTQVRLTGHCRLLRVFFQDEQYSDAELPPYLTFLG